MNSGSANRNRTNTFVGLSFGGVLFLLLVWMNMRSTSLSAEQLKAVKDLSEAGRGSITLVSQLSAREGPTKLMAIVCGQDPKGTRLTFLGRDMSPNCNDARHFTLEQLLEVKHGQVVSKRDPMYDDALIDLMAEVTRKPLQK